MWKNAFVTVIRAVLNGEKKSVSEPVFPKKPAGTPCAQPWLVAVGGWQLATGGWWRLVVVGGGWWLVIGGWWRLAVVGSWRLVAAGGWRRLVAGGWWRLVVGGWWRLVVDGSWRLAVGGPLGRSLRAVLSKKKKIWSLKDRPDCHGHCQYNRPCHSFPNSHPHQQNAPILVAIPASRTALSRGALHSTASLPLPLPLSLTHCSLPYFQTPPLEHCTLVMSWQQEPFSVCSVRVVVPRNLDKSRSIKSYGFAEPLTILFTLNSTNFSLFSCVGRVHRKRTKVQTVQRQVPNFPLVPKRSLSLGHST